MKLRALCADPAGNITLFVLDPVHRAERAALAAKLMRLDKFGAEQVGFVCPPKHGGDGRFEMMGGEFCGNATRAFGMFLAQSAGLTETPHVQVETSGCDRVVGVDIDMARGTADAEMPLPRLVRQIDSDGVQGTLVHLGGIAQLVVENERPSETFFAKAEPVFDAYPELNAYGVIFLEGERLTPLIKVLATDTLIWEGSCGSGSLAAAVAESEGRPDGDFVRNYAQPAGGVIRASVTRRGGAVTHASIGGAVTLGEIVTVDI